MQDREVGAPGRGAEDGLKGARTLMDLATCFETRKGSSTEIVNEGAFAQGNAAVGPRGGSSHATWFLGGCVISEHDQPVMTTAGQAASP